MGEPVPVRSWLIWHAVVRENPEARSHHDALAQLWSKLADRLTAGFGSVPVDFPSLDDLEQADGYALLAFRREPKAADHDYAYVYFEHDVVGIVVLLQSTRENDFDALRSKLPGECGDIPALGQFVTLVMLTDWPTIPRSLAKTACDPEGFITEQGFTLWNLKPEAGEHGRLLAAVPADPATQREFQRAAAGPEAHSCPPLLAYQVHAAKVGWMARQFRETFGHEGPGSLRRTWKDVDLELNQVLQSGAADAPTLLLQQQREGGLTLLHGKLKEWLITLQVAASHLDRLQPRAREGAARPFDVYRRDRDRCERLRSAIETELAYIETTADRLKAVQTVYAARLEGQRLATERERLATEKEKNYQNLVQGSILSGLALGLTVVGASGEYHYPELRWPLVAFSGALGFALPVLALHKHEQARHGAYRWAVSLLCGTFAALAFSYVRELLRRPVVPPPLWEIGLFGAAAFAVAYWRLRPPRIRNGSNRNRLSESGQETLPARSADRAGSVGESAAPGQPAPETAPQAAAAGRQAQEG
jgi:CASPASE and TPR Repeat-associated protein